MFCLRSWLPLLFIPTNASPLFILSFVILTYVLHRPCIYCSALLLILFASSCHWADRCFFDLRGDWYSPRFTSVPFTYTVPANASSSLPLVDNQTIGSMNVVNDDGSLAKYIMEAMNTTTTALAGAAVEEAKRRFLQYGNGTAVEVRQEEWTGIGLEWLRSLLGRREWTIPCIDVKIRL
ncbi:bladder cancer-related protein BC10-domain-containing protein [Talaromyces proteolyticus]|uniref:Bladder cancer-related protein BC10-domain-containing protein n=1 Tax=Talaromyces proteolyticus TaxID=1131652 RepID=A0AAD4Q0K6_9EURO|nr:bladder cancer-related protein BC10-domain-containing protein [Talaromyces proteolyticus]KAH8704208.1 bladder cancer-related protein BC10-domain-containing protein [Talaromyces proteolyticus]